MSLGGSLSTGFYTGGSVSADVPSVYAVALDGHPYLLDDALTGDLRFRFETIPVQKQQTQTSDKIGEASINPAGLWRSSIESWHHGAGQASYDLAESDPARFRSSKGADVWTRWELSALPDVAALVASANTNLRLAVTSTRLFWIDGTAVKYTDDLVTVSTMTGTHNWVSITTDGYEVYATDGTDVYNWQRTSTNTGSAWNTLNCTLIQWVKGRIMASQDAAVYNITSSSAPSAMTVATGTLSSDFEWVGFAAGKSVIYGAGFQGDKSLIMRTGIKADATGLDVWVQAGELPDGEIVRSIRGYLGGFILVGTDLGWRLAIPDTNGDLDIGALVETVNPVRCFEGQGSFVWYGLTDYDSTSTGLGRMSLTTILDGGAPAYASDLMTTAQGDVLDVCTFLGRRVFTVSGDGVFVESTNLVASFTLDSGNVSFGIPESKVALAFDVRHDALVGTVAAHLSLDGGDFQSIGTSATAGSKGAAVEVSELRAEKFEIRVTGTRSVAAPTTGPTVTRHVLSMNPTADTGYYIYLPVLLNEIDGPPSIPTQRNRNPGAELSHIQSLRASRDVVACQVASLTVPVSLEDYVWLPTDLTTDRTAFQGTCALRLKAG